MIHSRTLHALEFPQITEHLAGLCLSPAGRERALELRPLEDAAAVTHAARLYDESAVWAARPTGEGGFAGAITAALFLQRFVPEETPWLHLDTFAWRPSAKPGRPKGGEALGLRAAFKLLQQRYQPAK